MANRIRMINILVGLFFSVLTIGFWAVTNRPATEPPWPQQISGISFSPLRMGNDPATGEYPSVEEIGADLDLLTGKVRSIRTYGVGGTLAEIPRLARERNMTVTLGAWLTGDLEGNEREIDELIRIAKGNRNVKRVIIGNETILREDLTPDQLIDYLRRVRKALSVPVSTGEPWDIWLRHPELAGNADYLAAHFLPYWEGVDLNEAQGHIADKFVQLKKTYPRQHILLAEVGWPSNGRTRKNADASESNEATFLRRFLKLAQAEKYDYYVMEAFDQPWKADTEGAVGSYWGVYDVYRQQKFAFTEPIVRVPHWRLLAVVSVLVAAATFALLLRDGATLRSRGRSFLAVTAYVVGMGVVWIIYDYGQQYLTLLTAGIGAALAFGLLGIILVLLTEAHEMAEAVWVTRRRRCFTAAPAGGQTPPSFLPKVSIHVPAYNEPPAMMIDTLNALARLDYPDFEVLVIDNNTRDEAVWRPVEAHCRSLGGRFRFFHVAPLAGFKAGALNYALARTAPEAQVVAVIDSDYQVRPSWLSDLVPHFARPEIGFVQAPQDYRDSGETPFKTMCYAEYKGFFHIGMVTRNDRNAIIEHGTMTMVRTTVLREVGGWAEWCITEDAELGLRIFEHGHEGAYVQESYGRGLMPDTFIDFKKQRFRWAYGAVQILRRHGRELFGLAPSRLTMGQRYHFLAGWLPWLADGLNLFYTFAALIWSVAIVSDPRHVDPPLAIFMVPPLSLFVFKVAKLIYIYRRRMGTSGMHTAAAALAGLALSHTIAKAVVSGFCTSGKPFFRTPKCENRPALVRALAAAAEESFLALALLLAAGGVAIAQGKELPGALLWSLVLAIQSLPYLAALAASMFNVLPKTRDNSLPRPLEPMPSPR